MRTASAPPGPLIRPLLALLALLAAVAALPTTPTVAQGPSIPSYSIEASVDYDSATLQVDQTTRFRNRTGLSLDRAVFQVTTAYFDAFQLAQASAQGQPVSASLDGTVLDVPFTAPLAPGATAEVRLVYQLTVPRLGDRFGAGANALALGNWFPVLAPHRGDWDRHQYTDVGDAFVTEVADFDVHLTTSIPLMVAASGRVLEASGTSFRFQALDVRDFALCLSPGYVVAEAQVGSTVVRAYTSSTARSRVFADAAARFLRWYGKRYGAYPYRTFSVAEADLPLSYGGMEYPGLIFLSSALGAPSPFEGSVTEWLLGHEVAHQWFYSLVGDDETQDPWLDEAFANYLSYYYYRDTAPATFDSLWNGRLLAGLDAQARAAGSLPVNASIYDFPADGPYFTIVYRQGARFMDELRQTMGEAAFDAALADEVAVFADKLASPRAVLDLFQRHTSANLNPLIARYFSYGAFSDPAPAAWRLEAPDGPWSSSINLFVGADFPVTKVEVWLDSRRLYGGDQNAVTLDLSGVEPGDYALLVRVWDHRGAQFERARRVSVAAS